jgi:hypothetical protein
LDTRLVGRYVAARHLWQGLELCGRMMHCTYHFIPFQ